MCAKQLCMKKQRQRQKVEIDLVDSIKREADGYWC